MNHTKISRKDYYRLLDMLKAQDEESNIVALNIIENSDFLTNLIQIILLRYNTPHIESLWRHHAKDKFVMLNRIFNDELISFSSIFRIIKLRYVSEINIEDLELLFEDYAKSLTEMASEIFKEIKEVKIKLTTHGSESRTASESQQGLDVE